MIKQINKALNLVVPVQTDAGVRFAYSTPIENETFEKYHFVLAKLFARIYEEGLQRTAQPVAYLMLREIAERARVWEDNKESEFVGVKTGLIGEIDRLTLIYVPQGDGFDAVPIAEAAKNGIIDEETRNEVRSYICFFTALYKMHARAEREAILKFTCGIWDVLVTSSTFTEWHASWKTSTQTDNTGAKDSEKKEPQAKQEASTSFVPA